MGFRIEAPKQDGNARFDTLKVNLNENNSATRVVVADEQGNFYYGAGGTGGASGTSGTSGANGAPGANGTNGTSGESGTSGTSGTGFNTIADPLQGRVLLSDGSTNNASASLNLFYDTGSSVFQVTGSVNITGSLTGSIDAVLRNDTSEPITIGRGYYSASNGNNLVFGHGALRSGSTGTNRNIAIGDYALATINSGIENVALGYGALYYAINNRNTAVGAYALFYTTGSTGFRNNAFGAYALAFNTTGEVNSAFGSYSLYANVIGSYNVGAGDFTLRFLSTGSSNSALGQAAGFSLRSGEGNVFIGRGAAPSLLSGSNNTILGAITPNADINTPIFGLSTGSFNTIIGSNVKYLPSILDNNIILADGQGNIKYRWDTTQNNLYGNTVVSGSLIGTSSVLFPNLTEAPQNNVVLIDTTTGQLYYTASSNLVASSSISASYAPNIYNSDGTLTSNRIITANNNFLYISSSRTSGTTFTVDHFQTQPNSTETSDIAMQLSYNLSASSATNQLVTRAFQLSVINNLQGGGIVQNLRCFNLAPFVRTGATTGDLDLIYLERGAATGTVTNYRAMRVANYLGTNRAGITFAAIGGTNASYINMGSIVIPSGLWGIYQSEATYNNYFNGNVSIKTSLSDLANLQVNGNVWALSYTGSLLGTASFATTASYALNAGAGSTFPFSGSAVITGSLLISGSELPLDVYGSGNFRGSSLKIENGAIELGVTGGNRYLKTNLNPLRFYIGSQLEGFFTAGLFQYRDKIGVGTIADGNSSVYLSGSLSKPITSTNGAEINFTPQVNHQPTYGVIRIGDFAYGGSSTLSHIAIYSGQNTTTNAYGDVILQHDGTVPRGKVGVGKLSPNATFDISGSAIITGSLVISGSSTTYVLDATGSSRLTTLHVQNIKNPLGAGGNGTIDIFTIGNPGDAGYQKLSIFAGGSPYSTVLQTSGDGGGSRGFILSATGPGGEMYFGTSGTNRWLISGTYNASGSGHIFPIGDNLYNIGNPTAKVANYYGVRSYISNLLVVTGSTILSGSVSITGPTTSSGDIIPGITDTYNLGSSTNKWKDLYLSGSTIYLGDIQLKEIGGNFIVSSLSGNPAFSGSFTGSLFGSSSWATNSITASSADDFLVRGTLTAQTIVAQVITSSVQYITGSTQFGSLLTNTHQFTGSVLVTGSLGVVGNTTSRLYYTNYGTSSVNLLVSGQTPQTSDRGIYIGSGTFNNASVVGVGIGSLINLGTGTGNVAIGYTAAASAGGVAIGSPSGVGASSDGGVALSGTTSNSARFAVMGSATAQGSISISSTVSQLNGIGIGVASSVSAQYGIALGDRAVVGTSHTNSIAIGLFATTTAAKQLVIGGNDTSNNYAITDVYIGGGVQDLNLSNGTSVTINSSGGNGTDKNGGNITIAGGKGTGAGTPGDIILSTAIPTTTGTTLQSLSQRVWIKGNTGYLGIHNTNPSTILTVGNTSGDNGGITVLADNSSDTYDVFSGQRKYPRIRLIDSISGGSTFQMWNLGNQLRFGTNAGSSNTSAVNINAGDTASVIFNGDVGIKQPSPSYALDVTGTIRATGDVIAYSDSRVKDNVESIENALEKVVALRGVSYTRKDTDDKSRKLGVIAQEVLPIIPEVVSKDQHGNYSVSYGNMVGLLIEAIKEQQKQIDELKYLLKHK